jgi:hypothetical protein
LGDWIKERRRAGIGKFSPKLGFLERPFLPRSLTIVATGFPSISKGGG